MVHPRLPQTESPPALRLRNCLPRGQPGPPVRQINYDGGKTILRDYLREKRNWMRRMGFVGWLNRMTFTTKTAHWD